MDSEKSTTQQRVDAFLRGDDEALLTLCQRYDKPLRKVINAYMDPNMRRREDESDILQLTWIHAVQHLRKCEHVPSNGIFPLLRQIAKQRLIDAHRAHCQASIRNVYNEQELAIPDASVNNLIERLAAMDTSPSGHMERQERKRAVRNALKRLKPAHREILVLRFVEQLTLNECAEVLELTSEGAKSRQLRALKAFTIEIGKDLTS